MVGVCASVIFPCTIKSRWSFLLAPAHPCSPRKRTVKRFVCVSLKILLIEWVFHLFMIFVFFHLLRVAMKIHTKCRFYVCIVPWRVDGWGSAVRVCSACSRLYCNHGGCYDEYSCPRRDSIPGSLKLHATTSMHVLRTLLRQQLSRSRGRQLNWKLQVDMWRVTEMQWRNAVLHAWTVDISRHQSSSDMIDSWYWQ